MNRHNKIGGIIFRAGLIEYIYLSPKSQMKDRLSSKAGNTSSDRCIGTFHFISLKMYFTDRNEVSQHMHGQLLDKAWPLLIFTLCFLVPSKKFFISYKLEKQVFQKCKYPAILKQLYFHDNYSKYTKLFLRLCLGHAKVLNVQAIMNLAQ